MTTTPQFPLILGAEDIAVDRSAEEYAPAHASSPLASALARLEDVLREETDALRSRTPIDFAEVSRRKSRSLLELSRMARAVPAQLDEQTTARVHSVREALEQNRHLLGIHLAAAQEVGAILHSVLREAESDGTYSTAITYGGMGT